MHQVTRDVATMSLRYETAETLLLRRVLRREIASHAAILDSFPTTRAQPEAASGRDSASGGVRVKRERQQQQEQAVVDLVGEVGAAEAVCQRSACAPHDWRPCPTPTPSAPAWAPTHRAPFPHHTPRHPRGSRTRWCGRRALGRS